MNRLPALLPLGGAILWATTASAQTAQPKDKELGRPPQVRTYSTVTVVDDPAKAPRLPTQKTASPITRETPQPTSKDAPQLKDAPQPREPGAGAKETAAQLRSDAKAGSDGKSADRQRVEALRQDLRTTARELRETAKRDVVPEKATLAQPALKRTTTDPTPTAENRREQRLRLLLERTGRDK